MKLRLDGSGVWVRQDLLKDFLGVSMKEVRSMLTHKKPMFKGPPLVARGFECASDGKHQYVAIARGTALAIWIALGKPRWKFVKPYRGELYEFECSGSLLGNQQIVTDWIMRERFCWKNVRNGLGVCYMVAGAGTGKTHIGVDVARRCGGKALVLASRILIGKQWRDVACDYVEDYTAVVLSECKPSTRKETIARADMVVTTPATALKFTEEWQDFAIVIFDEIQQYNAGKWRSLMKAPVERMLGLTASPKDRPDTMDCISYWRLGRPVRASSLEGFDKRQANFRGVCRIVERSSPTLAKALADLNYNERLSVIAEDPERCADIAKEVRALLVKPCSPIPKNLRNKLMAGVKPCTNHNVMVFAERRAGVENITRAIRDLLVEDPVEGADVVAPEIMEIKGGVSEDEIARACAGARVVVTTFAYSSVGVSFDHMNAMVVDSSRKSNFYQVIKRIMRVKSDTNVLRQYTHIVDKDFKQFASRTRRHTRVYNSVGVDIEK